MEALKFEHMMRTLLHQEKRERDSHERNIVFLRPMRLVSDGEEGHRPAILLLTGEFIHTPQTLLITLW